MQFHIYPQDALFMNRNEGMKKPTCRDFIQWDVWNWAPALAFWRSRTRQNLQQVRALEIGAGQNGGLSLWLASQGASVVCSDCHIRLAQARKFHQSFALPGRIEYRNLDAANLPNDEKYDLVLFKSVLGAIGHGDDFERQRKAVRLMHATLKDTGELFFAENLMSSRLHRWLRKRYGAGRNDWRYIDEPEVHDLLAPFAWYDYSARGFLGTFGRSAWQRNLLGCVDSLLCSWIVPPRYRYVVYGVAGKQNAASPVSTT